MDRDQIAVFERTLELEGFVRKFFRVLFHPFRERCRVAGEIRVVVCEIRRHEGGVGVVDFARRGLPQELDGHFFVAHMLSTR